MMKNPIEIDIISAKYYVLYVPENKWAVCCDARVGAYRYDQELVVCDNLWQAQLISNRFQKEYDRAMFDHKISSGYFLEGAKRNECRA